MTDDTTAPAAVTPTPSELVGIMERVFNSARLPSGDEAAAIKEWADRITDPTRGSTLDGRDPANSAVFTAVMGS